MLQMYYSGKKNQLTIVDWIRNTFSDKDAYLQWPEQPRGTGRGRGGARAAARRRTERDKGIRAARLARKRPDAATAAEHGKQNGWPVRVGGWPIGARVATMALIIPPPAGGSGPYGWNQPDTVLSIGDRRDAREAGAGWPPNPQSHYNVGQGLPDGTLMPPFAGQHLRDWAQELFRRAHWIGWDSTKDRALREFAQAEQTAAAIRLVNWPDDKPLPGSEEYRATRSDDANPHPAHTKEWEEYKTERAAMNRYLKTAAGIHNYKRIDGERKSS